MPPSSSSPCYDTYSPHMADQPSPPPPPPPSSSPPELPAFTPFPPRHPIIMGVRGQSAFSHYTRPSNHRHWPHLPPPQPALGPSSSLRRHRSDYGSSFRSGFNSPPTLLVGTGTGGAPAPAAAPPVLGRPSLKRGRDGSGPDHAAGVGAGVNCSVCGKRFMSDKALFGHMRSHPDRGWKGAHPPPAFRAEEEFADIRAAAAAAAGEGSSAAAEAEQIPMGSNEKDDKEREEVSGSYQLPDLNNPPPPDDDDPSTSSI